jgi:uncharacterized Zn-finger protein
MCTKCDKAYKDSISLNTHMAVHTGKRSAKLRFKKSF